MNDYTKKDDIFQGASANSGAGYLIKNGRTREEVYLKEIRTERVRNIAMENEFHLEGSGKARRRKRKEEQEKKAPDSCAVATWTKDETQEMYFPTLREAEKTIERWHVLRMARPTIVRG